MKTDRQVARQQRRSPDELIDRRLVIRPSGEDHWVPPLNNPEQAKPPAEIWVRLTEPTEQHHTGQANQKLEWDFISRLSRTRWADQEIDLYFLSFGAAFMRPELFEYLQAVADRELDWRTHLVTDGRDLTSTATIDALLRSSLDELQVYVTGLGESTISYRVLEAVKDLVDLRSARGQNHPNIICRLCPHPASSEKLTTELSLWARQVCIDRLDITDKETEEAKLWGL
jgi:hypothetical protein